ncbi:MAG: anthranilate phosphoribosyltransferase [Candidatus Bathyarchaeota archaeon]|nr:anthranilate phosphoribosyltransferase [Candidatus Bathyarchaeota archaeon]
MIVECIRKVVEGQDLTYRESYEVMREIMSGVATPAQIAAFLTALRMKGETVEEISAFATVMREFCRAIQPNITGRIIDTCGTGGDRIKTFNVSTLTAFVVAGAGVPVAKHGNRSVTSKMGSADLLEKFGLNLDVEPEVVREAIEKVGLGFIFAPKFHPAMRHAIGPRREIAIRTVFNLLGPLTNPAGVKAQLLGVFDEAWLEPMALVLKRLGCEEAMVVYGLDGLDEISIIGRTSVAWLKDNEVRFFELTPSDFDMRTAKLSDLIVQSPEDYVELSFRILYCDLESGDPRLNMVLMNSSAALIVGGKADDFKYGVELASESIESGSAYRKLRELVKTYGGDLSKLEELEEKYG